MPTCRRGAYPRFRDVGRAPRRGHLGHFAAGCWHITNQHEDQAHAESADDNQDDQDDQDHEGDEGGAENTTVAAGPGLAELFVGGEGLRRGARAVLGTLLHEAAHGVASTRRIKDTSRQGRYHNRRFAELGITVAPNGARGWSATTLPDDTAAVYVVELAQLTEAITAYRSAEATRPGTTTSRNNPPATCGCEPARRIRMARSVLAAGPIVCGVCESEFTVDEPDDDTDGDGEKA